MEKGQGGPVVELYGNRQAVVDGCDVIVDYDQDRVVLRAGRLTLEIRGEEMRLTRLTESSAVIRGRIRQVEYTYGERG